MADRWVIIGVGPGSRDWVTSEAYAAIASVEVIFGSKLLLETLAPPDKVIYEITGDLTGLRLNLVSWIDRKVAILVSGDPGFYSLLEWVKREFPDLQLQVIPGISSMQLAFARLAQSWYDCKFISLHGRGAFDFVAEILNHKKVCILTDINNNPASIVRSVLEAGIQNKWLFIGSALGTPQEQIWQGKIIDYDVKAFNQPSSVVIIEDESLAL